MLEKPHSACHIAGHGADKDQHRFRIRRADGPGKARLLESIRDTGSISAAARDMGMSYKRAWLLLDSINQAFTEPVVRLQQVALAAAGQH